LEQFASLPCLTCESDAIASIKGEVFSRLANTSAVFGHGCTKPNGVYTLTLLRGFPKTVQFSAYDLPDSMDELHRLIEDGATAHSTVCNFADYIISTWNPCSNRNDWEMPNPHPSTYDFEDIPDSERKERHVDIVNAVNRHSQCGPWCERIHKSTNRKGCRYHFPFKLTSETKLVFEEHSRNTAGEILYRVKIVHRRNDDRINNFIPLIINYWRGNLDFQLILDPIALLEYMAKYAAKAEKASKAALDVFLKIARSVDDDCRTLTILRKAMLQMSGLRDYGAPEIAFTSLHLPLVSTNLFFESISLTGDVKLDLTNFNSSESIFKNTLLWFYSRRSSVTLTHTEFNRGEILDMNFRNFCYAFSVTKSKIHQRKLPKAKVLVLKFYPNPKPHGKGQNYDKHCMYQLIKYCPWSRNPDSLLENVLNVEYEHVDELEQLQMKSVAWITAYESFLKSPVGKDCIPT
jgi:hypothetical protein